MAAILSRPQCVNIYHFYTSDVFYTDVYYFTFVVPKMYQWQVRNDFNKDVYICVFRYTSNAVRHSAVTVSTKMLHINYQATLYINDLEYMLFCKVAVGILTHFKTNFIPQVALYLKKVFSISLFQRLSLDSFNGT